MVGRFPVSGSIFAKIFDFMKKLLLILVLLAAIAAVYYLVFRKKDSQPELPRQQPVAVSKYSEDFNNSVQRFLDEYYQMTEGFVVWDTAAVNKYSWSTKNALDSIKLKDVNNDTIYQTALMFFDNAKAGLNEIVTDTTWKTRRTKLNELSENIYNLLRSIRFDQEKVYYQECPMAFGEDTYGYWLNDEREIRNPYLGTSDPEWGSKMLRCGSTKDSVNFMPSETTK